MFELIDTVQDKHWFWDTELMVLAQSWGFKIKEFPVVWRHGGATKVNLKKRHFRDGLPDFPFKAKFGKTVKEKKQLNPARDALSKIKPEKKQIFYFSLIIFSILFQAGSGICGKYAAITIKEASPFITIANIYYLLSLVFLVLQAVIWQQALIHYPLSYAYPFISLVNFVILFFSAILFHEQITRYNVLGLIIISLGILILSRSLGEET
ncbi:hypothetical protein [Methanosarcina horonobensis]|uniref:hypothetical protein n=1 Tax=Methanosarcina horonobensis TaxID=418008 RepID=UPI0022B8B0E2|nr:hypothetical protein [Methanosarcina horonobensis]